MANYGYLAHHGIEGQKWGVRRYQNPDGSLTEAGRIRYYKAARKQYKAEWEATNKRKLKKDNRKDQESFKEYAMSKYEGDWLKDKKLYDKKVETNSHIAISATAMAGILAIGGAMVVAGATDAKNQKISDDMSSVALKTKGIFGVGTNRLNDVDSDYTLAKGQKIYRKIGDKDNINNGKNEMFVSTNKQDKSLYGAQMGTAYVNKDTGEYTRSKKPTDGYDVTMRTNKDIKIAGRDAWQKATENAFIRNQYYDDMKGQEGPISALAKAQNRPVIEIKKAMYDGVKEELDKNAPRYKSTSAAENLNSGIVSKDVKVNGESKLSPMANSVLKYAINDLKRNGYGGVIDLNDAGILAKTPTILFDQNDVVVESVKDRNAFTYLKDVWTAPVDLEKYMKK